MDYPRELLSFHQPTEWPFLTQTNCEIWTSHMKNSTTPTVRQRSAQTRLIRMIPRMNWDGTSMTELSSTPSTIVMILRSSTSPRTANLNGVSWNTTFLQELHDEILNRSLFPYVKWQHESYLTKNFKVGTPPTPSTLTKDVVT